MDGERGVLLTNNLADALEEFREGIGRVPLGRRRRTRFLQDWFDAHVNEKRARAIRDLAEASLMLGGGV